MSQKNIPGITKVEGMAIFPLPFTKGPPLPTEVVVVEEEEINEGTEPTVGYEQIEIFLGSLVGYILQGKEWPMPRFLAYLNRKFGERLVNSILSEMQQLRTELTRYLNKNPNTTWFSEVSFVPSKSQVERISAFCRSQTFHQIAAENGYTNPIEFVRDLLFSPEKNKSTLFIDGQELTLEGLLHQTKSPKNFGQDLKELEEKVNHQEHNNNNNNKTTEKKKGVLGEFLRRIINYYYFDFTELTKLEEPLLMKKIIASASARVDMLGFKVVNQDDQEAQELLNSIKEKGTLNHLLLNFNRLLQAEGKELIFKLLNLIIKGRIRIVFIEIKSYFRPEVIALLRKQTQLTESDSPQRDTLQLPRKQRNQQFKIPPKAPDLSSEESRDVSHSLLAMFQFFCSPIQSFC